MRLTRSSNFIWIGSTRVNGGKFSTVYCKEEALKNNILFERIMKQKVCIDFVLSLTLLFYIILFYVLF